ncbi:MAG: HPr family phosphocarrier protein [Opitutae bacterium]|nr:HPr family phosphocarrier protein [Opitutae bacterium]
MRSAKIVVRWTEGLHLLPAAKLVQVAKRFHSTICLRCGGRIADPRSILSIVALCATMGATLELEASGDDEQDAAQAVEQVFLSSDGIDLPTLPDVAEVPTLFVERTTRE